MNGIRFYLEFPSKSAKHRSGKTHKGHSGNVFAAFVANGYHYDGRQSLMEGLGSIFDHPNSPVAGTSACELFFKMAKRIPERLAREIHPELFRRLDD